MVNLLPEILSAGAEAHGSRLAVQDPSTSVTYAGLAERAASVAAGLRALGMRRGDRILVVLPNGIDFVVAHFGNLSAGAISVPLDAAVTPDSFKSIAASCRARCLLTSSMGAERLVSVAKNAGIENVICLDEPADELRSVGVIGAGDLLSLGSPAFFLNGISASDVAVLMYTTGTTAQAKGVRLTHDNVLRALRHICGFVGYSSDDREVVVLPLSHSFGIGHLYCNLLNGGAVYTENGLARVGRVLEMADTFNATGFPGTPMGFGMLMDRFAPVVASRCARLRFIVINSAPLPPERAAQLQELLPLTDIMVYYGLTEASRSTFISLTQQGPAYYRSVGRALGATRVAVRRADGMSAAPDEIGEIVIQGPTVTDGYWENPGDTASALRTGWLHTGDLGCLDREGFLYVTARLKDVINVDGYKVNPTEVEEFLRKFAGVRDVAVAGIEGVVAAGSESVVAAIVADPTCAPDLRAIEIETVSSLEKFKAPVRYVLIPQIPRTDTGKVRRSKLVQDIVAALHLREANA